MRTLTIKDIENLTNDKINSSRSVDKLVFDELLEMGFSYSYIGTHYLHDSIVYSISLKLEDFKDVSEFYNRIRMMVHKKYNVSTLQYTPAVAGAIDRAFDLGNINYILEVFKNSYDKDRMTVTNRTFIMTIRKKIMEALQVQQSFNTTQLRLIIQGSVENITDITLLQALCNIVASVESGVTV